MLAVPVGIIRGADLVHVHVWYGGCGRSGRTVVAVTPLVIGDQTWGAVIVGQHEGVGQLVLGTVLIGQCAFVACGVPVGDEYVGVFGGKILAQPFIQSFEIGDLVFESLIHLGLEAEFGYGAVLHIIAWLNARGF